MSIGWIIHILVLALAFLSIAYLVYAAAQKSEGLMKSVGTILAAVLAAIGVLALVGHLSAPMTGGRPFGIDMGHGSATASSPATTSSTGGAAPTDASKPSGGGTGGSEAAAPSSGDASSAKP